MIYTFKSDKEISIKEVGGKGRALIETTRAGLPVPDGVVLSVSFFKEWLSQIRETIQWHALKEGVTKEKCEALSELAGKLEFTEGQRKQLELALGSLPGFTFAIRSSSPEEDLGNSSFAGMYETAIGIKREMVESMVASVFSSCFGYRVMEYKQRNGIDLEGTAIAIIIQCQVPSDVSGVGFSINPLTNDYDEIMINATFGQGEAVVSGQVSPDNYIVDSIGYQIKSKEINEKQTSIWLDEAGGTITKENKSSQKQALDDQKIIELAKLIKECESFYNKPIDIEWAYAGDNLYLLQARPITTYFPVFEELLTEPGADKLLYLDLIKMTQGINESMSVLGTELWGMALESMKGEIFSCAIDGTAPVVGGHHYFNLAYNNRTFGKRAVTAFLNKYDGNTKRLAKSIDLSEYYPEEIPKNAKKGRLGLFMMLAKFIRPTIVAAYSKPEVTVAKFLKTADDIRSKVDNLAKEKAFDTLVVETIEDIGRIMNSAEIIFLGLFSYQRMKKLFKGKDVLGELSTLGMNLEGNPTSLMGRKMYELAKEPEFIETNSGQDFERKYREHLYSPNFMNLLEEFIKEFGVRGIKEIDIATPRINEDLPGFYERLKEINTQDNQLLRVGDKRKLAYEKLLNIAREGGFEKKFIKKEELYRKSFGYREYPKYVLVYAIAKLRGVCLELGEEFVSEGRLGKVEDIFALKVEEIARAKENKELDLKALREVNLLPYEKTKGIKDWPLVFNSRGRIYTPKLEVKDGDYLGTPIAVGKVVGPAKVLHSPYEKPLEAGEILVAKLTEPSWTPVFINASGVIMEIGGPLQHGGIIAREYGIPCVSGLIGIMGIIEDGDIVEVDGTSGVIRIIQKNNSGSEG